MGTPTGYKLIGYGRMISDQGRMEPYARALEKVVREGSVVLDIGAGTGIFSLLACQAGAGHVHAVETDNSIQVARQIATANGFEDRITFHQMLSTEVTLPAPADVMISDLRGILPLLQHHIPSIADARTRLLAPGGHLIPQCDVLWAAVIEDAELYRPYEEPWVRNRYDLDMRAGHALVVNTWCKASLERDALLAAPQRIATLDYRVIEDANVAAELTWTVERAGIGHGLALWFDTTLVDGIGFSNAPGQPELIYSQAFFPWKEPVELTPGDLVSVDVRANLVGDDYVWQWKSRVRAGDDDRPRAAFTQSTFFGTPVSADRVRKQEATHVPTLGVEGLVTRFILSSMDGKTTLAEIAQRAMDRFPDHFADFKAALTEAGRLAVKLTR